MQNQFYSMPIEELYAKAIHEIRYMSECLKDPDVSGAASNRNLVCRSMNFLTSRNPLDVDVDGSRKPVISLLECELDGETLRYASRGTHRSNAAQPLWQCEHAADPAVANVFAKNLREDFQHVSLPRSQRGP